MTEYTFPRELRLLTPSDFAPVFKQPIIASSPAFTMLACKNATNHPRLGLTIAKKKVKKAHARNRLKRLIRDSFRLRQHQLVNIDIVVMAKPNADQLSNEELQQQLHKLWKRLNHRSKQA